MASAKEWRGSSDIPSFGSSQGRSQGRPPRGSGSELTFQYHQVRRQEMRSSGVGGMKGIQSSKRPVSPRVIRSPLHPSAPSPTLEDAIREGLESTRPLGALRNSSSSNNHSWNESQSTGSRRGSVFKMTDSGGRHHQPKHPEERKRDSDYVNAFMKKHGDIGGSGFAQVRRLHEQASSPGRASSTPKFRPTPLSPESNDSNEPSIQALLSAIAGAKHLHQDVEPQKEGWEQSRLVKTPSRVRIKELDSEGGAAAVLWPSRSPRSEPEPAGQSAPSPNENPPPSTPPTEQQQREEPQQPTDAREGGAETPANTPPPSEKGLNRNSELIALRPSEDNATSEVEASNLSEVASNMGVVGEGESASSSTEQEMTSAKPEAEVEMIPPPAFEEEEERDVVFHTGEVGTPARFCWEVQSTGGASPATTLAHSRSVSSASASVLHSRNSSLASSTAALHAKSASWGGRVVDEGQEGEPEETASPREDETGAMVKEGAAGKAEEPETMEGPSKVAQDFANARRHRRQGSTDKIHVPSFEDVLKEIRVPPGKRASDGDKSGELYSQTNRLYGNGSFTSRSDDSSNASSSPRAGKSPAVMLDVQPSTSGPLSSSAVLVKEERSFSGGREAMTWSSPPHATASWLGPDEKVQKRRKWYHMFLCGAPSAA